jgi:uncharacterized protein
MRPSELLRLNRDAVYALVSRYAVQNPRLYRSVLHGTDQSGSDIDLLVDPLPSTTLFDRGDLQCEFEALLGARVDIRTPGDLPLAWRGQVVAEAGPL